MRKFNYYHKTSIEVYIWSAMFEAREFTTMDLQYFIPLVNIAGAVIKRMFFISFTLLILGQLVSRVND